MYILSSLYVLKKLRAVAFSYYYLSVFCVPVFIYVAKTWEINLEKSMRN